MRYSTQNSNLQVLHGLFATFPEPHGEMDVIQLNREDRL
jgi:hypothetical protein